MKLISSTLISLIESFDSNWTLHQNIESRKPVVKIDMRMNKRAGKTAADILNDYEEERLADIFYLYGELKNARRLASAIVTSRQQKRIDTTGDLMTVTEKLLHKFEGLCIPD